MNLEVKARGGIQHLDQVEDAVVSLLQHEHAALNVWVDGQVGHSPSCRSLHMDTTSGFVAKKLECLHCTVPYEHSTW